MPDWTMILNFILAVWPIVEKIVKLIEELFKGSSGTEKQAVAVAMVKNALPFTPSNTELADEIIGKVVNRVVAVKNWTGEFTHADPAKVIESPMVAFKFGVITGF